MVEKGRIPDFIPEGRTQFRVARTEYIPSSKDQKSAEKAKTPECIQTPYTALLTGIFGGKYDLYPAQYGEELADAVDNVLQTITLREQRVLRLQYNFDQEGKKSA